jgi:hypothetical protein
MIETMKLSINDNAIHYDRSYGIDNRKGWSTVVNGCVIVQLETSLAVAIVKTALYILKRKANDEQDETS